MLSYHMTCVFSIKAQCSFMWNTGTVSLVQQAFKAGHIIRVYAISHDFLFAIHKS